SALFQQATERHAVEATDHQGVLVMNRPHRRRYAAAEVRAKPALEQTECPVFAQESPVDAGPCRREALHEDAVIPVFKLEQLRMTTSSSFPEFPFLARQ